MDKKYKQLKVDFDIPDFLQAIISEFVDYLNSTSKPLHADLYEAEIRADLNSCDTDFNEEQYWILCNYYCLGGIYGSNN